MEGRLEDSDDDEFEFFEETHLGTTLGDIGSLAEITSQGKTNVVCLIIHTADSDVSLGSVSSSSATSQNLYREVVSHHMSGLSSTKSNISREGIFPKHFLHSPDPAKHVVRSRTVDSNR